MKRLIGLLAIVAAIGVQADDFKDVTGLAMKGDYQAQRNLAFSYVSRPYAGQKKDVNQACAWYLLILRSDSAKLNTGDVGNVKAYCDSLDFDVRLAAERKANALYQTIYSRRSS